MRVLLLVLLCALTSLRISAYSLQPSYDEFQPEEIIHFIQNEEEFFNIYLDADRSRHFESAQSIERGVRLAFNEVGDSLFGRKVKFVILDHHANTIKVEEHLKQFLNDERALVYFSGIHSPPLIKLRTFINDSKILTLVPWAAGAPITRHPSSENWVFRLSLDDSKAGYVISNFSVKEKLCKKPTLLLEETAWGDSNLKTMRKALARHSIKPAVERFSWNIEDLAARILLREIIEKGADCIQMVSNAFEGKEFAEAMLYLEEKDRVPIISHWGIIGGDFHKEIDVEKRKGLDLSFIQTSFSFVSSEMNEFQKNILKKAKELFPKVDTACDIEAPTGFIHAYDLSKILIAAAEQVDYDSNILNLRNDLRLALEHLQSPVQGLIKVYDKPFSEFSLSEPDAHEALGLEDYTMAYFDERNEIILY